jgi:flagellar hook-associated protein 1 FlgK
LLDGSPAEINFDETAIVTPFMTIDNGMLSGLEIDGRTIDTTLNGALGGGEMAAHFHVRDVAAVQAQQDLDVFAGNLIERFQSATVDPTITAGQTGVFTDNNSAYDPANQTSISKRIQLNTSVSLSGDGETWRLRDGMHASGIGDKGDTTILNAYGDALSDPQTVSSNGIGSGYYSAYDIVSNILTHHTQETTWGEHERAYASTIFQEMQKRELELGVDTDAELQTLIVLERIYGANARMLRAIDEMLDQLMRI